MSQSDDVAKSTLQIERDLAQFAIHDLKGAVHAIQGFLSVLRSGQAGPLTETQHDFLASAFITARRIERLVGDLQVFEFGERADTLVRAKCDLKSIVQLCVRELEPTSFGLGVQVVVDAEARDDWSLIADAVRLEQIIFNLIENAIRYADVNTTVRVRLRQSATRMLLVVENDSSAADSIDLKKLSAPLQRGATATILGRRGLGIGLSVVTTLVTAHGGTTCMRVRGSTVSIAASLPRRTPLDGRH